MRIYNDAALSIAQEIFKSYKLEKNMLPLGFKILCRKDNKNCLALSDNFFYMSESVKNVYTDIDSYCEMIETYPGELDRYNSNLKEKLQSDICKNLLSLYCL